MLQLRNMTIGFRQSIYETTNRFNDHIIGTMPKKKNRQLLPNNPGTASESDGSIDGSPVESGKEIQNSKKIIRRGSEWEILEGLKEGQRFDKKPEMFSGYLHKKRKWPLKGWHKRFFMLDKGVLIYGKGPSEIARGKIHGQVDVGLSVISTKGKRKRIDIDADEFIHHLKAKRYEIFSQWVEQLKKHRLYRQHLLTFGNVKQVQGHILRDMNKPVKNSPPLLLHDNETMKVHSPSARCTDWAIESSTSLEKANKEMELVQEHIKKLSSILEQLDHTVIYSEMLPPSTRSSSLSRHSRESVLSNSNPSLNSVTRTNSKELLSVTISASGSQSELRGKTNDLSLRNDFLLLAKNIQMKLQSIMQLLSNENHWLKTALGSKSCNNEYQTVINSLQNELVQAVQQNNDLRTRLKTIHVSSDTSDLIEPTVTTSSLSYNSCYLSTPEIFFDAEEFQNTDTEDPAAVPETRTVASDTSSEGGSICSEEGSVSSENSEYTPSEYNTRLRTGDNMVSVNKNMTGHREKLPCPKPNTEGLSLWSLLRKNIGVDLSRVSMPVALNEPLNMLQRLCEDLEYSELLDKAAEMADPYERMVYVAAFAVSTYCSSYYRAGSKPFNPLLGETYECVREDKGFRFLAEQVSHHPPISVCHAESKNFIFWQDIRIKTKFWGKSMEFQPLGYVNLKLLGADSQDHYRWNKVTSCVHNLFSGQRWADLSGELKITNLDRNISCKLTFVKPNYWSAKRHEVQGGVYDENGSVIRNLFGKWNEALYCGVPPSAKCVWRPGTMPENYELYYGFTRFAMELNELDADMAKILPSTDTRFRPDQRLLEEGDLTGAETAKSQLEQKQRDRRREMESMNVQYEPKWFRFKTDKNGDEYWEYNGKYWEMRKNPGFASMSFEQLW